MVVFLLRLFVPSIMELVVWIVIISMGVLSVGLGMCWRMGNVVLLGRR